MVNYTDYFSASYEVARRTFRNAVKAVDGELSAYLHPDARGAHGEKLTIDVGHIGRIDAPRQLIMISGTHGLEGFAGSALQIGWLKQLSARALNDEVGVLLIHGLNPYGFSHGSRTTVNGVDLNRNFIDHTAVPVTNALYAQLHPYLLPQWWDDNYRSACDIGIMDFRLKYGDDVYFNTFAGGQYLYPQGTCFGGFSREWESLTLERVVRTAVGHAERVAVIDWHTGIGEYGKPFYLNFGSADSEAQQHTAGWWGLDTGTGSRPHGRAQPRYQGLVFQGIESFLPQAIVAGGVIEFGTRGSVAGDLAIRQDLWLRNYGHRLSEDTRTQMHADLLDSLNPVSYQWREQVLTLGLPIIDATLDGLARWQA
ncbi:DUF2817 domain-containing protein [Pseudomonas sp. SLFW]|uniref:DUF2817 domain-containing protein n=1 Tax=Pseudomonas sp. SLFW TaxID=2683259 RepID=UPI0014122F5D|nr:DUF2817 domain-containing protein [Pseudomonas sp. SLFW]